MVALMNNGRRDAGNHAVQIVGKFVWIDFLPTLHNMGRRDGNHAVHRGVGLKIPNARPNMPR